MVNRKPNQFCHLIIQNITIGIRSILFYEEKTDSEKLEAIKWLNEFHHRVGNLKLELKKLVNPMKTIEEHAKYYANKNNITSGEINAIIKSAFDSIARQEETK